MTRFEFFGIFSVGVVQKILVQFDEDLKKKEYTKRVRQSILRHSLKYLVNDKLQDNKKHVSLIFRKLNNSS